MLMRHSCERSPGWTVFFSPTNGVATIVDSGMPQADNILRQFRTGRGRARFTASTLREIVSDRKFSRVFGDFSMLSRLRASETVAVIRTKPPTAFPRGPLLQDERDLLSEYNSGSYYNVLRCNSQSGPPTQWACSRVNGHGGDHIALSWRLIAHRWVDRGGR